MGTDTLKVASEVINRIYEAEAFSIDEQNRTWLDQAATQIALIAGDDEIRFIDHEINVGSSVAGRIVAITDNLLIVADVDPESSGGLESVRIIARRSLVSLKIEQVTNAIKYEGGDWPRALRVTLGYGGESFSLPFHKWRRHLVAEMSLLVPSLARDLNH
ncbi:hypothetical protein N1028_02375 [Herbiconiux sp. CPCC 203407]|uniref:Uncharacterized protein n=1 Tax=Herbiconiux oxytropis TaxID=2970915 RepID=A0AA41XFG6_9MICO|nr:hypothetical protein [Herbiconiux oxytropis]MCS5721083.1 hypothetical protein [Herbiconiux oxytropis]MCS5724735.1 hypothetical protein [Herbiconiux oxytropis]